jgi:hypothetical protein
MSGDANSTGPVWRHASLAVESATTQLGTDASSTDRPPFRFRPGDRVTIEGTVAYVHSDGLVTVQGDRWIAYVPAADLSLAMTLEDQ